MSLFRYFKILFYLFIIPIASLTLCNLALAQGHIEKILSLENQLLVVAKDSSQVNLLHQLALLYEYDSPQKALACNQKALTLARSLNQDKYIATSLLRTAKNYMSVEQNASAIPLLEEATKIYQKLFQKEAVTDCLTMLALCHYHTNEAVATDYIAKASIVSEDANYDKGFADVSLVQGLMLEKKNKLEEAKENYTKALNYYKQVPNVVLEIAQIYTYLAQNSQKQGKIQEALQYYAQSLESYQKLDNKMALAHNLNSIAQLQEQDNQSPDQALPYYFQAAVALQDCHLEGKNEYLLQTWQGISRCYNKLAEQSKQKQDEVRYREYQRLSQAYTEKANELLPQKKLTQPRYNPADANLTEQQRIDLLTLEKQKLAIDNLAKKQRISYLEALQSKARLQLQEDSVRLLQKDINISDLQKEKNEAMLQINSLKSKQASKEVEYQHKRNIQWAWIAGLAALFVVLFLVAMFYYRYSQKTLTYNKNKIQLAYQRITRQESEIRGSRELAQQKEKELAAAVSQLDEQQQQHLALRQMISEDLQSPLTNLVEQTDSEPIDRSLVHEKSKQLLLWVTDILEVTKLENTSKIVLFKENFSLYKTAKNAIEHYSTLLREKEIYVENNIKTFYQAHYDRQVVEKVILNFLSNAIKYAPEKGAIIKLDALPVKENGQDYLKISIEDNGKSIPDNLLHLVFDKFAPEEARPIGLSLVYNKMIVEAHGGKISVSSHTDLGTTFYFTLMEAKSMEDLDYQTLLADQLNTKQRTEETIAEEINHKIDLVANTSITEQVTSTEESTINKNVDNKAIKAKEVTFKNVDELIALLTPEHKDYLKPFLFELARLEYYEITAVKALLTKVQIEDPLIIAWRKSVEHAIYYLDERKFIKLTRI